MFCPVELRLRNQVDYEYLCEQKPDIVNHHDYYQLAYSNSPFLGCFLQVMIFAQGNKLLQSCQVGKQSNQLS